MGVAAAVLALGFAADRCSVGRAEVSWSTSLTAGEHRTASHRICQSDYGRSVQVGRKSDRLASPGILASQLETIAVLAAAVSTVTHLRVTVMRNLFVVVFPVSFYG